jgi:uncharacterized protein (DUF952 family)
MLIYKIAEAAQWTDAVTRGTFDGSADDKRDGFIHLSTAAQARETAAKHFAGRAGLVLAAVQVELLGALLRWEPSRGGALFPHVYGPLPMSAVAWTRPLPVGTDGHHAFPQEVI